MDLNGKKLDVWFLALEQSGDLNLFPHGENYPSKYKNISDQLYQWVHPEVAVGTTTTDNTFLTNHGINHIKTLIARATQFVDGNEFCILSPFEVFLLLMAIHVHDVGNILGRKGHEVSAKDIIDKLKPIGIVGQDDWIWNYVYDIAKTHKGFQIETLPKLEHIHDIPFRPQLLAGILKFADELAEDFSRSSKINVDLSNIPEDSNIYHVFASCVNSIIPKPLMGEIEMIFNLKADHVTKKFKKEGKYFFLMDEIYIRTLRTYSEKVYCMKFLRPYINFNSIKVTINIRLADGSNRQHGYELSESVISDINLNQVLEKCPELKGKTGKHFFDEYNKNTPKKSDASKQSNKKNGIKKATAKKNRRRR